MRATGLVATSLAGIVLRRDRVTDHPQQPPPPQRQALWPADLIEDTVRHDHQIVIVGQGDGACLESGNSVLLLKAIADAAQIIVDLENLFTALSKNGEICGCIAAVTGLPIIQNKAVHAII